MTMISTALDRATATASLPPTPSAPTSKAGRPPRLPTIA
jgi:hypothetical protein